MRWPWETNFGPLFKSLAKAYDDYKANAPRPVVLLTPTNITTALDDLEVAIPIMRAWIAKNPGALTAADDLLEAFAKAGVPWLGAVQAGLDATPGAFAKAADVLSALDAFLKGSAGFYQAGPGEFRGR